MSSRALRKAQREKEEQDRLKQLEQEAQALQDEEPDNEAPVAYPKKSAFAMLLGDGDEDEDEDELEEAHEDVDADDTIAEAPAPESIPKATSKKKKKKKKQAKNTGGSATPEVGKEQDMDEIDAALKELSMSKNAFQATTTAGVDQTVNEASKLLAIDTNHLHAQNEMRRLFGRAALQQDDDEQPAPEAVGGNRRQQRRVQQVGLAQALRGQQQGGRSGLSAIALRRNIFIQGKEEWPMATSGGLSMDVEEKRADGTVLYRFAHNTAYQDVQSQFETCVASMDPNRLVALLRLNPYHISTLLQVSEIAKQDRDHATSGDLLERALFSYGRSVHSTFAKSLAEGKARLDFRREENREFWLASWRYMQNLTMRATWRTVYEWAKLLLSLSPEDDPYALWLVLDQYALRSRQDLDYLNISRNATFKAVHHDMPNVQLTQGLAEFRAGNQGKGKQALFTAVGKYPWVVARLCQELNLDPPPGVWGKEARTEREKLHAELYATRAKDLWNTPETTALLNEIASALPPDTPAATMDAAEITREEARHVLLSDVPSLIALIPRSYTSQLESSSDPLPPEDSYLSYLSRVNGRSRGGGGQMGLDQIENSVREIQNLHQFFARLFPWFGRGVQGTEDAEHDNDGAADDEDQALDGLGVPPDQETLMRQVEAAGVSRQEFQERAQRLSTLQAQLFGGGADVEAETLARIASEQGENAAARREDEEGEGVIGRPHQTRAEDGPDED